VIFVPMKKSEIRIIAMAKYPMISVGLGFMFVLCRRVCLRLVMG
jgi:hypothetical protein